MSEHFQTIERVFLEVSDQVKKVFPNLDVMWIVHNAGQRAEAMEKIQHKFQIHPSGAMMRSEIEKLPETQRCAGIACAKEKSALSPLANAQALACFFIDVSEMQNETYAKLRAYMDVYQVLNILNHDHVLNRALDLPLNKFIASPDMTDENLAITENLECDIFSVIACHLGGMKQSTHYLARYRTQQVLKTRKGVMPEWNVFPVVADTVRLLLREYMQDVDFKKAGLSPLFPAFSMTREIINTFPMQVTKSWQIFCRRAQIMAWAGHDPETILGAAVYYTEDAFIRTDAHLACDILGLRPQLMTRFDFYNAFADDELNERRHLKLCNEYFEMLVMRAAIQNNAKLFMDRIHRQNESFLLGTVMGWCAPALMNAMEPLKQDYSMEALRESHTIFKEKMPNTSWAMIKKMVHILFDARRKAGKISSKEAANILKNHKELEVLAMAFEY